MTTHDTEVELMLDKGIPVFQYIMPDQILAMKCELPDGHRLPNDFVFSSDWCVEIEAKCVSWLLKNGFLLDPRLGLSPEVRKRFDERRLTLNFERVLSVAQ